MKNLEYKTSGTCSRSISVSLNDDGTIASVAFVGGCNGNLQGISTLVKGEKATDMIKKLRGIKCGAKKTSCPDQLANALEKALR